MISLAPSSPNLRASSDVGEAAAPGGEGKGTNGPFSVILAALGTPQADAEGEIAASTPSPTKNEEASPGTPEAVLPTTTGGITLPLPAESGKTLPDIAGAASDGTHNMRAEADEGPADGNMDGATAAMAVPLLQLPVSAAEPKAAVSEAAPAHSLGRPGPAFSVDAEGSPLSPAGQQTPVKRQDHANAETPAVTLHVAPQPSADRSTRRDIKASPELPVAKSRETAVEGILPKPISAEAPQTSASSFAQGLQVETSQTARPMEGVRPAFQSDALQDLTRIVDRLTAAREASAPAAAALAVKHVEFGDLSLRFDQQRDGHLAVQLSAGDPDTHRAVAAAVNERSAAAMGDSHTGTGQSQAQPRGAAAERDGNGGSTANGNAARHEQSQQRRSAPQDGQPGAGGDRRAGIFA